MHGRWGVHGRGHVWPGGMRGRGVCVCQGGVLGKGGMHGGGACVAGGCACWGGCVADTVNEQAVRILLECIFVHAVFDLSES